MSEARSMSCWPDAFYPVRGNVILDSGPDGPEHGDLVAAAQDLFDSGGEIRGDRDLASPPLLQAVAAAWRGVGAVRDEVGGEQFVDLIRGDVTSGFRSTTHGCSGIG